MSTDTTPRQNGLELSDIIPFASNNQPEQDASNPMNTVMAFVNTAVTFGAATSILGGVESGAVEVAGAMPGGTGFEPAAAGMAPAPSMAPAMSMNRTPGMGGGPV